MPDGASNTTANVGDSGDHRGAVGANGEDHGDVVGHGEPGSSSVADRDHARLTDFDADQHF